MTSETIQPDGRPEPPRPETVPASPATPSPRVQARPPRRGGAGTALAVLLALAALGAGGYALWQQQQQTRADQQALAALRSQLDALEGQRGQFSQQLDQAGLQGHALDLTVQGLAQRTRSLEGAVGKLSEQSFAGHRLMLLDGVESLLRLGQQRYQLLGDAQGAAKAFALAAQALAATNDTAYQDVAQAIETERQALLKGQPQDLAGALATLGALRQHVGEWPLRPLDTPVEGAEGGQGIWARVRQALASVVSVRRDNGAPLAVADARLARELMALDLAQAQAALLDHDNAGYQAALARIRDTLQAQFDAGAPAVLQANAQLAQLAAVVPPDTVALGQALAQLREVRGVQPAVAPAATGSTPAPAAAGSVQP